MKLPPAPSAAGALGGGRRRRPHGLPSPSAAQVAIALEEMGLEYEPHLVDIMANDQFSPEFVAVNPNSKIPAIVDPDGPGGAPFNVFESGAILQYLAEYKDKSGKFLSKDPAHKWETIQWLMFQMGGVGPMFGQLGHFYKYGKDKCDHPYPLERYSKETKRLLGVLEKRLEGREYLIDDGYSIADMATFPWVHCLQVFYEASDLLELQNFPNVLAWKERCASRPATAKGMTVCKK
eukprot:SM000030S11403  [mRNA]  locus=s30:547882:549180:+ [translate_table: standard]